VSSVTIFGRQLCGFEPTDILRVVREDEEEEEG
jgi:hypothetical protein